MRFITDLDKESLDELKEEGYTLHIDLSDQGAASVQYFPLVGWGDEIGKLTRQEIGQSQIQARAIEAYIRDQNNDGFQVKLFPKRVLLDGTLDKESLRVGCTAFRRRKPKLT